MSVFCLHGSLLCCAVVGASMEDVEEAGHGTGNCGRFASAKGFRFTIPCTVRWEKIGERAYPSQFLLPSIHFLQPGS